MQYILFPLYFSLFSIIAANPISLPQNDISPDSTQSDLVIQDDSSLETDIGIQSDYQSPDSELIAVAEQKSPRPDSTSLAAPKDKSESCFDQPDLAKKMACIFLWLGINIDFTAGLVGFTWLAIAGLKKLFAANRRNFELMQPKIATLASPPNQPQYTSESPEQKSFMDYLLSRDQEGLQKSVETSLVDGGCKLTPTHLAMLATAIVYGCEVGILFTFA